MVSQHPLPQQSEVMRMRLPAAQGPLPVTVPGTVTAVHPGLPPWRFEITAGDGTLLLAMSERDGFLVVEGDESRWDEAAARFLHHVMQWSGQAGIAWKDRARRGG